MADTGMAEEPAIRVTDLTKRYRGTDVVDSLSFQVQSGEFFGLLGPNGAGKTTTIRMLAGLLPPTEGTITVAGCDVGRDPLRLKQRIGLVSDDIALYERLSSREFLEFAGRMYGLSAAEARERTDDLLQLLDLGESAKLLIADYSLGMKKKVSIAAALIHRPQVLFLDEPFNGVDTLSVITLCRALQQMVRTRGVTILFTSHGLDMVERLCDRVAILHKGQLAALGSPADLCADAGLTGAGARLEQAFCHFVGSPEPAGLPAWL